MEVPWSTVAINIRQKKCYVCYVTWQRVTGATRSAPTDSRAVSALAYVWLAGVLNRFKIHNPWDKDPRTKTSKSKLRQKIRFCSQVEGFAQTQKTITDHDGVEEREGARKLDQWKLNQPFCMMVMMKVMMTS